MAPREPRSPRQGQHSPTTERRSESCRLAVTGSARRYLGEAPGSALGGEGWFSTGEAVIHPDGTMQITDRKKDLNLIKSSSADRLLIGLPAPGASPTKESVLEFLEDQVARLWLPDDVVFVDAMPPGPSKVQKTVLGERYNAQSS
jgi:fatty-acyl-CoA synthase